MHNSQNSDSKTGYLVLIFILVGCILLLLIFPRNRSIEKTVVLGDHDFYPGNYSKSGVIGNSLPGTWRPFSKDSPWNTPISANAKIHPYSPYIMETVLKEVKHIALINRYLCPIWVVNSKNVPMVRVRSDRIFDTWDKNYDGWSDVGAPLTRKMWGEPTEDGQICVVDPFRHRLWDISSYRWVRRGGKYYPRATTFDIWNLLGLGVASPPKGTRWVLRGGRGSGFPGIAGIIRPEELKSGEIRHALVFSFNKNRIDETGANIFISPASRSDGSFKGIQYPIEGMRFQLNPVLTERDFDAWGLNREGKILARALQKYGMYLGLGGGAMKLEVQLLGPTPLVNRLKWERSFPGFYKNIKRIPTQALRVIYTGEPVIREWEGHLRPDKAIHE